MSGVRAVLVGVAVAALAACGAPVPGAAVPAAAPAAPVESVTPPATTPPTTPVDLAVPAIAVHTGPLLELGIGTDGALQVPPDAATAGWFTLAPTPGSPGPAVIAGHVDYAGAPGVFQRLGELAAGDEVRVARADGSTAVFEIYLVKRYAKARFPTERVYGDTTDAELRLITCGGSFDGRSGHYRDNVVAYGRLVRVA